MTRRVQVLPRAQRQLYDAALWWSDHRSMIEASNWLKGMESAINGLKNNAERFPLAEEAEEFDFQIRQMNFGLSGNLTHRVLFSVCEDRVVIYAIRHLAQRNLTKRDIE